MPDNGNLRPFEHQVMKFFADRPKGEEWASALEVFEDFRQTNARTSIVNLYRTLERLTGKDYLERELGEPKPERANRPQKFYRATSNGTRVYNNTVKAVSRSPLHRSNPRPAPIMA